MNDVNLNVIYLNKFLKLRNCEGCTIHTKKPKNLWEFDTPVLKILICQISLKSIWVKEMLD